MREYRLGDLVKMWAAVLAASRDVLAAEAMGHEKLDSEYCQRLSICLDGLTIGCENFDADSSLLQQMRTLENELKNGKADTRCSVVNARLSSIMEGIQDNLDSRKFMFVSKEDAYYWDNLQIFGGDFLTTFPIDAVLEMREIGNCFVASRPTACVFHCMRVAEYGLRKLAGRLRVKLTDKGAPIPIEYGTWDKVIQQIRAKIADARKNPIGPKKEQALQFYSAAADQCEYMKDIWRNEISHTRRRSYTKDEVLGVINRVRDFVTLLAKQEIPKNPQKQLDQINRQIEEMRKSHGEVIDSAAKQPSSQ
jgi:hypothetical protein